MQDSNFHLQDNKTLLYAIETTVIVSILSIIFYVIDWLHFLILINPVAIFFNPDTLVRMIGVIPGTLIYYLFIIGILRIGMRGIKMHSGMAKKVMYVLVLLAPITVHFLLVFIGAIAIAFGGD